jgi:hypothetical protein
VFCSSVPVLTVARLWEYEQRPDQKAVGSRHVGHRLGRRLSNNLLVQLPNMAKDGLTVLLVVSDRPDLLHFEETQVLLPLALAALVVFP